jgi:hypothetical protein
VAQVQATKAVLSDEMARDYEWFHTAYTNAQARVAQVQATKAVLSDEMARVEADRAEVVRLRTELGGQQQSCRDLVADYNANAAKVTFGSFKGWSLPDRLDPLICE